MIEFISLQKITAIPDGDTVIQIPESHVMISTGQVTMRTNGIPQQIFSQYITPFTYKRKVTDENGICNWMPIPRSVSQKTLTETEINFLAATVYQMNPALQQAPDFTQTNGKFAAGTAFEMAQTLGIPLDQIVPFTNLILNSIILESVNGGFKAQWQNLNFVTEYIIQYRLQGATEWVTVPVIDALTNLDEEGFVAQTVDNLTAGTYEVKVKAVDAYREGDYSPINTVNVG